MQQGNDRDKPPGAEDPEGGPKKKEVGDRTANPLPKKDYSLEQPLEDANDSDTNGDGTPE